MSTTELDQGTDTTTLEHAARQLEGLLFPTEETAAAPPAAAPPATPATTGDGQPASPETAAPTPPPETPRPAAEEPKPTSEAPPTFKVRGKDWEEDVPLDELLKGYSRTRDYTQKTMALADQRKALEADAERLRVERAQYGQGLEDLKRAMVTWDLQEPDPQKLSPEEFTQASAIYRDLKQRKAEVEAEQKRVTEATTRELQGQRDQRLKDEHQLLLKKVPEWQDAEKARQERADLVRYIREDGFSDQDIANVDDHRILVMARKAMLWDRLQEQQAKVANEAAARARLKPASPGGPKAEASPKTEQERAQERLVKTGKIEDAARFFASKLNL